MADQTIDRTLLPDGMIRRGYWAAFLPILFLLAPTMAAPATQAVPRSYSRTAEFPPVGLSYGDLVRIAHRARAIAERANVPHKNNRVYEQMEVMGQTTSIRAEGILAEKDLRRAPSVSYSASYSYSNAEAPISSVQLWLADYRRELSVEGTEPDQVDALFATLSEDMSAQRAILAGPRTRMLGSILLQGIALSLAMVLLGRGWRDPRILFGLGFAVLIYISVWTLPWERWLCGARVYAGDADFITRNSALFTFLGVVLTVLLSAAGFFWSWYQARLLKQAKGDSAQGSGRPGRRRPKRTKR